MSESSQSAAGKPRELQGWSNRLIFHPLAQRLATALVPTPVTPNMVSVFGAVMVATAGVLYASAGSVWPVLLAFALHLAWHVVDGADGALARQSGRASPSGEIVDGLCDYGGHAVVYTMLAARLDDTMGWAAWAIALGAGLSRAIQSVFAEGQRRSYQWWAYGVPWLRVAPAAGGGVGGALARLYLAVWRRLEGPAEAVDALVTRAANRSEERARIAAIVRQVAAPTLPLLAALGANPRTVLLGLSMLAGGPLPFFLVEVVLLNLVMALAVLRVGRSGRRILQLAGAPA